LALGAPTNVKPRRSGGSVDGLFYRSLRVVVRAVAWILFRFTVVGAEHLPPTGAAVVVANHQSWLDPIIVPLALPRKPAFLAMEELWRMPVIGTVMRVYGPLAIPLNRGAVDATALKRSLRALQGGALLIIFPEGGISPDGRLRPFHDGAAMLAARAKVPMIPVAIRGTADALPLGRLLPRRRPVTVRIGPPIAPPGLDREALTRASETAAAQIDALRGGAAL
jgi:1-acyl-sn-glycerol-3-phosphate acyltransferase